MESLTKMLEKLYSSDNGMLYFYIVTGTIALLLIILIIISINKGKKKDTKSDKEVIDANVEDNKDNVIKEESSNLDIKDIKLNNSELDLNSLDKVELEDDSKEEIVHDEDNNLDVNNQYIEDSIDMLYAKLDKISEVVDIGDDDIEMPKTKESTMISNDDFIERLNALKNK